MLLIDHTIESLHAKQGCYLCTSPNQLIDTEVLIPFEGILAVCVSCTSEMARAAGFEVGVTTEEIQGLRDRLEESERDRDSAVRAIGEVKQSAQAAEKRHRERSRHHNEK